MDAFTTVAVALAVVALAALFVSASIYFIYMAKEVRLRLVRPDQHEPEAAFDGDWRSSREAVEKPAPLRVLPRGMAPGMDVGHEHDVMWNPPWADEDEAIQ